jgi:hypothetical protein
MTVEYGRASDFDFANPDVVQLTRSPRVRCASIESADVMTPVVINLLPRLSRDHQAGR